jgi:hypothetical protein
MTGDYLATAKEFFYTSPANAYVALDELHLTMSDTTGMQAQEYGNIAAPLANGFTIKILDDTDAEILDFLDGEVITTNGDLVQTFHDVELKEWGSGNEYLTGRLPMRINSVVSVMLSPGWKVSITLNDTLTGLLSHRMLLQGRKFTVHP